MHHKEGASYLGGDTSVMNLQNFTKDIVIVTAEGNLAGMDECKAYCLNYLTGFTEIK